MHHTDDDDNDDDDDDDDYNHLDWIKHDQILFVLAKICILL